MVMDDNAQELGGGVKYFKITGLRLYFGVDVRGGTLIKRVVAASSNCFHLEAENLKKNTVKED
jgi:hypothetical protein